MTDAVPVVLSAIRPSPIAPRASIFSPEVDSQLAEPSSSHWNEPAVFGPVADGTKRAMSWAMKVPTPGMTCLAANDIRMWPLSSTSKAVTFLVMPTSEPSKTIDQPVAGSNFRMSAGAKATPPTVPLPDGETRKAPPAPPPAPNSKLPASHSLAVLPPVPFWLRGSPR